MYKESFTARSFYLLAIVFITISAYGQRSVVMPEKMNVLYLGMDNPLSIAVENISSNDLIIETDNGSITKSQYKGDWDYNIYPARNGIATIFIKNKKGKTIGEHKFRVKRLPDPILSLGGRIRGGAVSKAIIKAQSGLVALLENIDIEAHFPIVRFETIVCSDGDLSIVSSKGPIFSKRTVELLTKVKSGDIIRFDNVIIQNLSGVERRIEGITISVDYEKECYCKSVLAINEMNGQWNAENTLQYSYACNCGYLNIVTGKYYNGEKDSIWEYRKVIEGDTILTKRETYHGDTLWQIYFDKKKIRLEQEFLGEDRIGESKEYYTNGKLKSEEYYTLINGETDTIVYIDPITFEEYGKVIHNRKSKPIGVWKYFDINGILIKEERKD